MSATLPLRAARRVWSWFAAPVVGPPDTAIGEPPRPLIYLAPLTSRVDAWILRASLGAAGLPEPAWIPARGTRAPEERVREEFLAGGPVLVPLSPPRTGPDRLARLVAWAKREGAEVDLVPIEVLWGPVERTPSLWNVLLGNPYEPAEWRRMLRVRLRDRVRVIIGAPGSLSRLREESGHDDALAVSTYVRGQAVKALSQTERSVFGDRYKVPRLLVEQILREPDFQDRAAAAGAESGLTRGESLRQAEEGLRELATGHNLFYMELLSRFVRWLYTKVYDAQIAVPPGALDRLRELGRESPLIFVPSHKSNFDHLVLYHLLFSSGFPPPHTAAGINMSFFPMSRILPGTGAYFIRRSFQDDPVYKECLRGFIAYLVQHRFHQEFFIEGGRSRSGKLLPPRYGMLNYVVEGVRRTGGDDVCFVPTAIAYDQIAEIGDYVREQLGDEKKAESFAFLVRMIRSLRRRSLGRIYVHFGAPISLRRHLEQSGEDQLVVEKLAFQIANRINAATPFTAVSAVCSALVGAGQRALSLAELQEETQRLIDYAAARSIAIGLEMEQGAKIAVMSAIEALRASGVVEVYDGGIEPVHFITAEGRHQASYYRNTTAHFFLVRAIAALAREASRRKGSLEDWALRLRDLLKFEFFFSDRETFLAELQREAADIEREENAGVTPLRGAGPRLVLDYLEGYWVVTRTLRTLPPAGPPVPERELLKRSLSIGRQLLLQRQVDAPELLSSVTFRNALRLAENRGALSTTPEGHLPASAAALDALSSDLETLATAARHR